MQQATVQISIGEARTWRGGQIALWILGLVMLSTLFFSPDLGLRLLWNIFVPLAPALFVVMPGVWRNVCPLGSTSLLPRHTGRSARKNLTPRAQGLLGLGGVMLLLLIVPLRHVLFNANGVAAGILLIALALLALILGRRYEWKSAWCAGLCPVHPVEKLYGVSPVVVPKNAHCSLCEKCVAPCPDSTKGMHPLATRKTKLDRIPATVMIGGFPGFVWGWFQVPDYQGVAGWAHIGEAYLWPLIGMATTLALFLAARRILPRKQHPNLTRIFSCAAVVCYYWFRLPLLIGFGIFPGDGVLVNLSADLPGWFPNLLQLSVVLIFGWLILWRGGQNKRPWTIRPPFAS